MELRIDDLQRYSISVVLVDAYNEIPPILEELNRRSRRKHIFVSGSAYEYGVMGRERVEALAFELGQRIYQGGLHLVSGFGLGIAGFTILGMFEGAYTNDTGDLAMRATLRPFPQSVPAGVGLSLSEFWKKYRRDLIGNAGFAIFLSGNKQDPKSGQPIVADGVLEEFAITKALGRFPIPIGCTGFAARTIWDEVSANLDVFYPGMNVKKHFKTIGAESSSNDAVLDAVFAIVKQASKSFSSA